MIAPDSSGATLVVNEKTTVRFTGTLVDDSGAPVALTDVSTLTLVLYCPFAPDQDVIRGDPTPVDIKNINGGTFGATDGAFTLTLTPADNAIVDANNDIEWHRALIQWTYSSLGSKSGKQEIDFQVKNLSLVS